MNNIQYLTIIPDIALYVSYKINDQKEVYSKEIEKGEDFFQTFLDKKDYVELNELLYSYIPFIIDVENRSIIELTADKDLLLEELRKEQKEMTLEDAETVKRLQIKEDTKPNALTSNVFDNLHDKFKNLWK